MTQQEIHLCGLRCAVLEALRDAGNHMLTALLRTQFEEADSTWELAIAGLVESDFLIAHAGELWLTVPGQHVARQLADMRRAGERAEKARG